MIVKTQQHLLSNSLKWMRRIDETTSHLQTFLQYAIAIIYHIGSVFNIGTSFNFIIKQN